MSLNKNNIGAEATIYFRRFNVTSPAKVDTGASMSSIGSTDIFINEDSKEVTFKSKALLEDRSITLPVVDIVQISSADGGITDRPVIELDIRVDDSVSLSSVRFNLTDRSHMDTQILIGQDVLEAGNFVVDVTESSTEDSLSQATEDSVTTEQIVDELSNLDIPLSEVFTKEQSTSLHRVDLTFKDILKSQLISVK